MKQIALTIKTANEQQTLCHSIWRFCLIDQQIELKPDPDPKMSMSMSSFYLTESGSLPYHSHHQGESEQRQQLCQLINAIQAAVKVTYQLEG